MENSAVLDGGAPAPADTSVALRDDVINVDNPIDARIPAKEPEQPAEPKKAPTSSDAIKRAMETVKAREQQKAEAEKAKAAEPPVEPKQPVKSADKPAEAQKQNVQPADDAARQQQEQAAQSHHRDAPQRFSQDAKTEWANAPESVKAETHRALKELESGLQKYKAEAEEYEQIREYRELAKHHGVSVKSALDNYVGIERMLHSDLLGGLERIIQNVNQVKGTNITLRDIAGHILNQTPDQVSARQDGIIQSLNAKIERLEAQLGGVSQTIEQQHQSAVIGEISAFAAQHPRFEELAPDIEKILKSPELVPQNLPHQQRLSEAYKMAERLNPAPSKAPAPAPLTPATPEPLNPAGKKSIGGAPSSSNLKPGKGRVMSSSEAIRLAMGQVG